MKPFAKTPLPIKIVAFAFIAIGPIIFAASLLLLSRVIDRGLIVLPLLAMTAAAIFCISIACAGVGLLRLSPKSRCFALCTAWTAMGFAACSLTLIALTPPPGYQWQGAVLPIYPTIPGITFAVVIFSVFYLKYYVLTHSKTRRLFDPLDY